jgi:hypothetical protein
MKDSIELANEIFEFNKKIVEHRKKQGCIEKELTNDLTLAKLQEMLYEMYHCYYDLNKKELFKANFVLGKDGYYDEKVQKYFENRIKLK